MTPVRPLDHRLVLLVALLATCLAVPAGGAAGATAPVVDAQHAQTSGRSTVAVPGQRPAIKPGTRLRPGQVLISRRVVLAHGQRVNLVLVCPAGTTQRGLGIGTSTSVVFEVVDVKQYIGVRRVRVLAVARVDAGKTAMGHIYGLCS
jgi:hypothetical protein